ncbi:AMP-binding protein, partial [Erythrobacter donghaensis]|uniref:AMP-binding protein n=3 Tax=Erythrobacter donghaensis TaxID=267135 RepID=UPI000A5FF442
MSMHPIAHAAARPDHPAVIMTGSGEAITYGEMEAESNRFARLLRAHGIGAGDAFAVLLENRIEYFTLIWGSQRAGTMLVPISSRLTAPEAAYIIRDAEAKLLITSGYFAAMLGDIRKECPGLTVLVMDSGDAEDFAAALAAQSPDPIPDQSAGMVMLYSSGTTGRPKGIRPAPPA